MRIADYIQDSIVDGPGLRFTLFTQGCPHKCPGCHNPGTHDAMGGREESTESIIAAMLGNPLTDGITLSGGEPFMQPEDCAVIAGAARKNGLNVWAYSGWTIEQLLADPRPAVRELLERVDVLIDGPFRQEERSLELMWKGSRNQRMIDVRRTLDTGSVVLWEE